MRVMIEKPRLVIASYKGKAGKTIATLAIAMALIKAGYRVSMFKVGPDFIDPSYHTALTGKPSRNLDYVLMGRDGVIKRFYKYSADSDIAIIEGVSGLYDSVDGVTEDGSTAQVAKLLGAPVILVINGERINRTVRALIRGLRSFDPGTKIVGAVLTNVNQRQIDKLNRAVEEEGLELVGFIPRSDDVEELMQYRHLGLIHAQEMDRARIVSVINEASKYINADKLMRLAREGEPITAEVAGTEMDYTYPGSTGVRVGIVMGRAFTFIDVGLNNLFAVVFNHTDVAILIKGSTVKAEYYWWKREVKTYQSVRDWLRNHGFESWKSTTRFTYTQSTRGRKDLGTTTALQLGFWRRPCGRWALVRSSLVTRT